MLEQELDPDRANHEKFDNEVKRKHFLSKIDIKNFQMQVKDFGIKQHEDDAMLHLFV